MRKSIVWLLVVIVSGCLPTTDDEKYETLQSMKDWVGNWEMKTKEGLLTESWVLVNDSTLEGTATYLKLQDTLHSEVMTLSQRGEKVVYESLVKGQNEDKPVVYELKQHDSIQSVFVTTKQDYPQQIQYQSIHSNSLSIRISGVQRGKKSTESYVLSRVK